ncbi:MAG: TIGR03936 family radical SAM-associated protein [Oscillospiraceae bacterium]|nr:TIGR03936 family radical SAM-associated protein [Oscillospiraceae bacterium]
MNRLMSRAVRRAGLPLWYTEGFNPHPYMTFALPLPLGQAGEREPVDIRLVEEMSFEELKAALNRVLPEDVQVVDVTVPIKKAREISLASYRIDFHCGDEKQALELLEQVSGPLENGELLAEKRSKRGTKQVNLCDFVHSFAIEREKSTLTLNCVLDAGNTKNLNAALLAGALLCGIDIEVDIRRLGLFCGSEEFE